MNAITIIHKTTTHYSNDKEYNYDYTQNNNAFKL